MISIIIPAYNEVESLPKLISYLKSNTYGHETEIIVSDGGSTDNTAIEVERAGAKCVHSIVKGRAAQMNFGASKANGSVLYFLHADSYPPITFINDIYDSLARNNQAGCFRLKFDDKHRLLLFYSWFSKFDVNFFRFGDQSLFITKELFEKLTGFDEHLIVMEDQVIVREIKRLAAFEIMNADVITSARKYKKVGIIKLQLIFTIIVLLFYLGVSQEALVSFYKKNIK